MNPAVVITACATSHNQSKAQDTEPTYKEYFDNNFNLYYILKVRKYYHFEPMMIVVPDDSCHQNNFKNDYIPQTVLVRPTKVESKTLALEYQFSIRADKCKDSLVNYVKNNITRYENSDVWRNSDKQVTDMYLQDISNTYNINLDRNSLKYTNQFCWEIETNVR